MNVKFTWLGTANYILELDDIKLMFDPFFQRNEKSTPLLKTKREDIKDIKAIFISHAHFDHITEAAWYAENSDVPVYCSETAKNNAIRWANGEIIENESYPISDRAKFNLKVCEYFDKIELSNKISVELIKSEHIKFDMNTIFTRLFSWKFLKQARTLAKYGRAFPLGKVFGFCTYYNGKRIVSFGSLWHKYEDILQNYQNCNLFITPLAGNSKKNIAKKGGKMVDILKPNIVIPIHWDNFFPPISRTENLTSFLNYLGREHPSIQVIMPEVDKTEIIRI
jgi:L-ascorbate metabolism protein UlaG (beta-lactamase superfamily)